jgi:hypothetical protein
MSFCGSSVRRAPFGDPEGFGEKDSGNGYVRFTGNPERKCETSALFRHIYLESFFLDPENDRELRLGALVLW